MPRATSAAARRASAALPTFALYGEADGLAPAPLHIESIDARSRRYDWEIDSHVHQGLHQIIWLRAGRVDAMLDDAQAGCDGPAALVVPPAVAHAFRFSPDCDGFVLTLDAAALVDSDAAGAGEALRVLFAEPRACALEAGLPQVARLDRLFEALHAEIECPDATGAADGPVPMWLARAIVWHLARVCGRGHEAGGPAGAAGRREAASRQPLYTRWVVLLEAHYREHWPVSRYAAHLGLSTERLNRLVRAETGLNAQRLIHRRLAREASRRLVHVAAPVSALAFELGFDDPAYFCRFFRREVGVSPSQYRARAQQGRAAPADAAA